MAGALGQLVHRNDMVGPGDYRPPSLSKRLAAQILELETRLAQLKELQSEMEKQPQVQELLDKLSQLHI